jgi:hypothetical protein
MASFSSLQFALVVVAVLSIVGVVISFFTKKKTFSGYEDIALEARQIARFVHGEMFRDGDDLGITGNYRNQPVMVRFSYSETTPGLNIRFGAPVSFTISVVPKGERASEGRVLVRTGVDMFDARFATRTDQPTQAKMILGGKSALAAIQKLCCGNKTFLTMTKGSIELSELIIPAPSTAKHVQDHIESMAALSAASAQIPGAEAVKVQKYEKERTAPVARLAIMAGAAAVIIAALSGVGQKSGGATAAAANNAPVHEPVPLDDANVIGSVTGWHVASTDEFNPDVATWMTTHGETPSGHLELDVANNGSKNDFAYMLESNTGIPRLVVAQHGAVIDDRIAPGLVGIARVPMGNLGGVEWASKPPRMPQGEAVLAIFKDDAGTLKGQVLFPENGRLLSGRPNDYRDISLQ